MYRFLTANSKQKKQPEAKKEAKKETGKPETVTLPSGLKYTEAKVGSGAVAKKGRKVEMRYIGKLTNSAGKVFDKNTSGKPFRFTLGRGEVIKGWDEGIEGMRIGGERELVIPPQLAYGAKGAPPAIPKNATLHFEVKLVDIK